MYWHGECREKFNRRQNMLLALSLLVFVATGGGGTWMMTGS
jgi:hypothetical protein